MFKKILFAILVLTVLTSCSDKTNSTVTQSTTSPEIITPTETQKPVDVDLTTLNKIMMYGKINDMVFNADDYVGKTVKMTGNFDVYYDEKSNTHYFSCQVPDPSACCVQGIEFVHKDNLVYPDDYPEIGNKITIMGDYSIIDAGQYEYISITNAEFVNY